MNKMFIEPSVEIIRYKLGNVLMTSSLEPNDLDHKQEDIFDWGNP